MRTCEDRIEEILRQAKKDKWGGHPIPYVPASLRLAISSLAEQTPEFWRSSTAAVVELLRHNKGVRRILNKHSDEEIAFAIRDRRL